MTHLEESRVGGVINDSNVIKNFKNASWVFDDIEDNFSSALKLSSFNLLGDKHTPCMKAWLYLTHLKDQVISNDTLSLPQMDISSFVEHFSMDELTLLLKTKSKPSAAGFDMGTYEMVKSLQPHSIKNLLVAINENWKSLTFRDALRIKIFPIPKRNKDLEIYTNFRPIALISVFLKIINLMLKFSLIDLSLKHFSACINEIIHFIGCAKERNEKVVLVSLDISKAYDCVNLSKLYNILKNINCPDHITLWILNFLKRRILTMGNEEVEVSNGLPQGSCPSPTLFNIYTTHLHNLQDAETQIFQFADDFIIISSNPCFDTAVNNLQRKLITVSIDGNLIENVKGFYFLGRYLNKSLTVKEHYDDIIIKSSAAINAIKMLTPIKAGINPKIALNLSKSLVFSKAEYARTTTKHKRGLHLTAKELIKDIFDTIGILQNYPRPAQIEDLNAYSGEGYAIYATDASITHTTTGMAVYNVSSENTALSVLSQKYSKNACFLLNKHSDVGAHPTLGWISTKKLIALQNLL
ncbi:LINE-1 retrotransposable element ORF2 protein [Lucilia cuprina]|nr:LINE-1 retrotransposable element ORF2 protein [Lucilia cuprina]